jgi:type IV pilus assembly protein PilQ
MNLPNHRRVRIIQNILGAWIILILLIITRISQAETVSRQVDDIRLVNLEGNCFQVTVTGQGEFQPEIPVFLDNPARVIFDFQGTVLGYNDGRARKFPVDVNDLSSVGISQYQRHPDVVRLVFYFKAGDEKTILNSIQTKVTKGNIIFTYDLGGKTQPVPGKINLDGNGKIINLLHQRIGPEKDRFTFQGSAFFQDPSARLVNGGVLITFKDTQFEIPSASGNDFQVPVSGALTDEIQVVNQTEGSTVFIRIKDSARLLKVGYQINRKGDNSIEFDVMRSYEVEEAQSKIKPVKSDQGQVTGLVQVLGSNATDSDKDASTGIVKIVRIQYQPLSIGERFIIEAYGNFKPSFQKLKYPNRLILTSENSSVVLPVEAEDRFQIKIEGAISKVMKVFLTERDGVPESSIQFYYEIPENEDIQYSCYATENENIYYLDLVPIAVSSGKPLSDVPVKLAETHRDFSLKDKQDKQATAVVEEKTAEPEVTVTKPEIETKSNQQDQSGVTFNIPDDSKYEKVVEIPSAPDKAAVETESTPSTGVESVEKAAEISQPVEEVQKEKQPEAAIETVEPAESAKETVVSMESSVNQKAPIQVEFSTDGKIDKFILTSTEPIDEYSQNELSYPNRLAIEFPGRKVDFNKLKPGAIRYLKGESASNVRIIERDLPVLASVLYIYLDKPWEVVDCSMSGSPDCITIEIQSQELEEVQVADAGIPLPQEPVKTDVQIVEKEQPATVQTKVEPAIEEPQPEVKAAESEEPQAEATGDKAKHSFVIESRESGAGDKEYSFLATEKEEQAEAEVETPTQMEQPSEKTIESVPVEEVEEEIAVVEIPVQVEQESEPEEVILKEPVTEAKPEVKIEEKSEKTAEAEKKDNFVAIKIEKSEEVKPEDQLVAKVEMESTFPLKQGEREIPPSSISSFESFGDAGFGAFLIRISGGLIPDPEINWWNYPSRLSLNFDGVGVDIGDSNLSTWEQKVDSQAINKVKILQHSGGRVDLSSTVDLYLNPDFDKTKMDVRLTPVDSNTLKVELLEPRPVVASAEPEVATEEPEIQITDEDLTISDLDKAAESKPVQPLPVKSIKGSGRYLQATGAKGTEEESELIEYEEGRAEPLVTIIVQNADIEDVILLIAEEAGLDVSLESKAIKGTISLKVTKKPVSEVFNLISTQGNFKWNKYKGTYIFGSEEFIWDVPGVIQTRIIRLKYADPLKVRQVLSQLRIGSPRSITLYQGSVGKGGGGSKGQVPTAQNALVLKGDDAQLQDMIAVIQELDVPPLLIKVNMKVIEYSITEDRNFGFDWRIVGQGASSSTDKGFIAFNLKEKQTEGPLPLTFQGFQRSSKYDINLIINFLDESGDAKILADSTLTIVNGGEGTFFVGETVPYRSTFQISDFGRVTQRIQQENIGINLKFRAQASDDGMITLYLNPDIRNLKEVTDIGPRTSDKKFDTTVRIPSGQPYAIGGLINESDRVSYNKIPFVGDLPLVGKLFQNKKRQHLTSELIIVFTPEIVHDRATQRYSDVYNLGADEGVSFSLN